MTYKDFLENVLEPKLAEITNLSFDKSREYSAEHEVFHNFMEGARMDGISPQECLWDYMRKHLVSVSDVVHGRIRYNPAKLKEKTKDIILYMILLEAIMLDDAVHDLPNYDLSNTI